MSYIFCNFFYLPNKSLVSGHLYHRTYSIISLHNNTGSIYRLK